MLFVLFLIPERKFPIGTLQNSQMGHRVARLLQENSN
jgi:hypothetical protein